jgi:hypothetical protein
MDSRHGQRRFGTGGQGSLGQASLGEPRDDREEVATEEQKKVSSVISILKYRPDMDTIEGALFRRR